MTITAEQIKKFREQTGAGIIECREALVNSDGDFKLALEYLRKKGNTDIQKRSTRSVSEGVVWSYIHPGNKIGVLLEIDCETDFSSRSEDFHLFAKDISMHIAAANPKYISREDVPQDVIDKEQEIILATLDANKPAAVINKIVAGRMNKFYQENCLLDQVFVKDADKTVKDVLVDLSTKIKENIVISRFTRFQLGQR